MARKVTFDLADSISATIQRLNQMDEWLGDLDELNQNAGAYLPGFPQGGLELNQGPADTSVVHAAQWLHHELEKVRVTLFGYDSGESAGSVSFGAGATPGTARFSKVLVADSAVIQKLTVSQLLQPIDSDLDSQSYTVLRDSLDSGYYNPQFDLGVTIDSGYIKTFHALHGDIGQWFHKESDLSTFFDSGQSFAAYNATFNYGLTVDSANIVKLSGPHAPFPFPRPRRYVGDSGYDFDSSEINITGDSMSRIGVLKPWDSGNESDGNYWSDSSTNFVLRYDSGTFNRIVVGYLDSSSSDSAISKALSSTDSAFSISVFKLPNLESSYDSISDWRPGVGVDSQLRITYHGDLTDGFRYTTMFAIYDSTSQLVLGGHLLSQYDSDNRI